MPPLRAVRQPTRPPTPAVAPAPEPRQRRRSSRPRAGRGTRGDLAGGLAPLVAGAAAFGIAFPPFPPLVGALLALAAFAIALQWQAGRGSRLRGAVAMGALFGTAGYAPNMAWLATGTSGGPKAVLVLASALLVPCLAVALAAGAFHLARRGTELPAALLLPLCWVAGEVVLGSAGDVAFPWLPVGLSVAHLPLMLQSADLSGVHGVSAWIAAVAGALADGWRLRRAEPRRAWRALLGAAALLASVAGYGAWRLRAVELVPSLRLAAVQPNIGPDRKHDPALLDANVGRLTALTRRAASLRPQLVLWPETALAGMLEDHPGWRDSLQAAARGAGAPVLTGIVQRLPPGADGRMILYNAAVLTDSAGRVGAQPAYRKRALVPVTERIPFVDPAWFSDASPPPLRGFTVGTMEEPFTVGVSRVGTLICFESAFAGLARRYRERGATLIVNLTNDAVLGAGRGPAQHLAHLPLRAAENRVAVVQVANSGVTAYADPRGVLHGRTPRDTALVAGYEVQVTSSASPYTLVGDWSGGLCLAGAALLALIGVRRTGGRERRG